MFPSRQELLERPGRFRFLPSSSLFPFLAFNGINSLWGLFLPLRMSGVTEVSNIFGFAAYKAKMII